MKAALVKLIAVVLFFVGVVAVGVGCYLIHPGLVFVLAGALLISNALSIDEKEPSR